MKRAGAVGGLCVALALVAPGTAQAAEFFGASEKGKTVNLRTAPDDRAKHFSIVWRSGDCNRPGYRLKRTRTGFLPRFDRSEPGLFVDRGSYRAKFADATVRFRVHVRGRMVSDTAWKGSFTGKAFLELNDGGELTCRTGKLGWHVERRANADSRTRD